MSILYDKTCFIKDVKPPRATASKRPTASNTAAGAMIQTLCRFPTCDSIVDIYLDRHRNCRSRHFFVGWNIVGNQDLHLADIAHHETRDAHQQCYTSEQHKYERHAGTTADADEWTKNSCQGPSRHHPWLEYEIRQWSSGQHRYGHGNLRDHQARAKDLALHVVRHLRLPDSIVAAVEKRDDERSEKSGDEPDGQRPAKPHEHDTQSGHGHHAPQNAVHLAARSTLGRHESASDDTADSGHRVDDAQCGRTITCTRQDHGGPQRHAHRCDEVRGEETEL